MIRELLEKARRRMVAQQFAAEAVLAASLVLGALILVLLLGTQILDWSVFAVVILAGIALASYRLYRQTPSLYTVARLVDAKASLYDSLSTAWIFDQSETKAPPDVAECQRSQAESLASSVHLPSALPYSIPRLARVLAALAIVACGLMALRYGVTQTLDLKPPLTTLVMDALGWNPPASAQKKPAQQSRIANLLRQLGVPIGEPTGDPVNPANLDPASETALQTIGEPMADNSLAKTPDGIKAEDGADGQASDQPGDSPGEGDKAGKSDQEDAAGSPDGPDNGAQQPSKANAPNDNSSLLSKLKDAMNNMMSKSKSQAGSAGQKSPSPQGKSQADSQAGEKGQAGQGKQDGGKDMADAAQDAQQQNDTESGQNSSGKGGGKSADRQASSQPGSGIGKQDGSKDLRAAEQEKAMGKLSEVIGKRSANVAGEMTIEVQSSNGQIRTGYSSKTAGHGLGDGEMNRDNVPLDLQPYVSGYFEEVHRQATAPAAK